MRYRQRTEHFARHVHGVADDERESACWCSFSTACAMASDVTAPSADDFVGLTSCPPSLGRLLRFHHSTGRFAARHHERP